MIIKGEDPRGSQNVLDSVRSGAEGITKCTVFLALLYESGVEVCSTIL